MKPNGYGRALPPILRENETPESWPERRAELMALLREQVYGFSPEETSVVTVENEEEKPCFAGKANLGRVILKVRFGEKAFSFPVRYAFPRAKRPAPVFVVLNFRPEVPDLYLPAEEILDGGFGFAQLCYTDVVNDRYHGDFSDGLGKAYYDGSARRPDEWGKIGMWAYAASRVIDWLYTREEADKGHIMVIGHSRLGKTALYTGMSDERVWATFVNDSGAGGASIARHKKTGETIHDIVKNGIWDWFADNYRRWENKCRLTCILPWRCLRRGWCASAARRRTRGRSRRANACPAARQARYGRCLAAAGWKCPSEWPCPARAS